MKTKENPKIVTLKCKTLFGYTEKVQIVCLHKWEKIDTHTFRGDYSLHERVTFQCIYCGRLITTCDGSIER